MNDLDDLLRELGDLPHNSAGKGRSNLLPSNPSYPQQTPRAVVRQQSTADNKPAPTSKPSLSVRTNPTATAPSADLDALLQDLELDSPRTRQLSKQSSSKEFATSTSALVQHARRESLGARPRCGGLCLGGTSYPRGRNGSTPGATICCDNVRCTKCDFKVTWFADKEWLSDVDYLFFRNCYPTISKLLAKTRSRTGVCAYCCQCSWTTTQSLVKIDFSSDLRWVCAGH